jgi:hypothetical protein
MSRKLGKFMLKCLGYCGKCVHDEYFEAFLSGEYRRFNDGCFNILKGAGDIYEKIRIFITYFTRSSSRMR